MTEIKFRQPIWRNGKFSRWHYWGFVSEGMFTGPCYEPEQSKRESQQFTGLKDKNGKEIYEGDVLHQDNYSDWVVCWNHAGFNIYSVCSPDMKFPVCYTLDREVIGNIYENPNW